jgi:hypothetical protein
VGFLVTVAVLVVAPPSGGAQARVDEARAAIVAAERTRGVEVVEDAESLVEHGWTAEVNLRFFAEAAALVRDGQRALTRVELQRAEELFALAERIYDEHPHAAGVRAEHAEAAKWHGVAWFELKSKARAEEAWAHAKWLDPTIELTEAMVRPEVAHAFADVKPEQLHIIMLPGGHVMPGAPMLPGVAEVGRILKELRLDEVVVAAIAIDGGSLTYAAARMESGCGTPTVISTSAQDLVRKVHEAPCRESQAITVYEVPEIVHPRPAPAIATKSGAAARPIDRRVPVWRKPLLWVGVVGAVGVGVVLGVTLWPRQATYSAGLDFHQFALGVR